MPSPASRQACAGEAVAHEVRRRRLSAFRLRDRDRRDRARPIPPCAPVEPRQVVTFATLRGARIVGTSRQQVPRNAAASGGQGSCSTAPSSVSPSTRWPTRCGSSATRVRTCARCPPPAWPARSAPRHRRFLSYAASTAIPRPVEAGVNSDAYTEQHEPAGVHRVVRHRPGHPARPRHLRARPTPAC